MRKTLGIILVLFAAAGAPLAHVLRVAEVAPVAAQATAESRETQYRLVLANAFDPIAKPAKNESKAQDKNDAPSKQNDVRLLKVLDEQWESSARTQVDTADVPVLPLLVHTFVAVENDAPEGTLAFVPLEFSPPNPPARGPPL